MTTPVWQTIPDSQLIPPPAFAVRARRELSTQDTANARMFEHWHTDTPSLTMDRPQPTYRGARYQDMNPDSGRQNFKNYDQSQRYVPSGGELGANPYFQQFDVTKDPRNVVRELRTAVSEDKQDRGVLESKEFLSRSQVNRWIPPNFVAENNMDTLSAYDRVMKKEINDMKKIYR